MPTLGLKDIPKTIEYTDCELRLIGSNRKVRAFMFDQPTNGISYFRAKVNLKNLPEKLRLFVPMFAEFLSSIGTKDYRYDVFDNKMLSCTSGVKVQIDKYCASSDHEDLHTRSE